MVREMNMPYWETRAQMRGHILQAMHRRRGRDVFVVAIGSTDRLAEPVQTHGWRALFVQPVPALHERLAERFGDAPEVRLERAAIGLHDGMAEMLCVPGHPGTLLPVRNALASAACRDVVERHAERVRVPCLTLPSLFARNAVERVDVLHVDVEGHEWMVLRQLDFTRWRPAMVIVRWLWMTPDDRAAAEARLRDAGYEVTEQYDELVAIDPTTPSTDTGTTFVTAAYDLSPDDALGGRERGLRFYLASLRSLAKMRAPFVIYTWPRTVDEVRAVARDEGLPWEVVGFDLAQAPRYDAIQAIRLRKDYPSQPWRDRCHVLCLAKVPWLAAQARMNPFGSDRFYWVDAGLSYPGLFPHRFLDVRDRFECSLIGPETVTALNARPEMRLFGIRHALSRFGLLHNVPVSVLDDLEGQGRGRMHTHVVGGLFGGPRAALGAFADEYDEVLAALLAGDHLGTEENVLSVLYHRRPERYAIELFTTWYHEDSGSLRPPDDSDSFFRIFERFRAPLRSRALLR
jgi:FkbM family methyltransferase